MKCPRCVQVIHRGAELCPHCGFGMRDLDERFGSEEVVIRRLSDGAGLMKARERQRVEVAMDRFQRRFPQLFFSVFTGTPGHGGSLRQLGFWVLNRAAYQDVPVERPNEGGILLTVDPDGKAAGLTWGYLLDPYLTEDDCFVCLTRAHAYWLEGRYADGVLRVMLQLEKVLAVRSRQARRDPERFEKKVMAPRVAGEIARRIREGHRRVMGRVKGEKEEVR